MASSRVGMRGLACAVLLTFNACSSTGGVEGTWTPDEAFGGRGELVTFFEAGLGQIASADGEIWLGRGVRWAEEEDGLVLFVITCEPPEPLCFHNYGARTFRCTLSEDGDVLDCDHPEGDLEFPRWLRVEEAEE